VSLAVLITLTGCISGNGSGVSTGSSDGGDVEGGQVQTTTPSGRSLLTPRGGSDGRSRGFGGSGPVSTGLPADATLSALDSEQAAQVCQAVADAAGALLSESEITRLACTIAALTELSFMTDSSEVSIDQAMCDQLVSTCMSAAGGGDSFYSCDADTLDLAGCNATIGELEACIDDALSLAGTITSVLSCETLANPERIDPSALQDVMEVATCSAVQEQCPGLDLGDMRGINPGGVPSDVPGNDVPGNDVPPSASGCENTCEYFGDGDCDDGGPDADYSICGLGTDCDDCGPR
jgi:hypothetical protein